MKTKLVIFGITGDLSTRKLLPALEQIINTGQFNDLSIIGVSRRDVDVPALLQSALGNTNLESKFSGFTMDMSNIDDYKRLKDTIGGGEDEQTLVYLSVPPDATSQIIELLGESGINTPQTKIMLEKPFGTDLDSAHEMIDHVAKYYDESQVYRIDHYLAKEMSQNIVAFRGGNALFDHVWDNRSIEKIEIIALEKIGIEGRVDFYEQTGALRDFVQGHLMQLLALVLMETPEDFDWNDASLLRAETLDEVMPADPNKVIRGQYDTYRQEVNNPESMVETFVSIELASDNPKWQGVPIYLCTGKALSEKLTEVRVHFKKSHEAQTNCLVFKIQPTEGVDIQLVIKKPGYDHDFETKKLSFEYAANEMLPDAYEQVIVDATLSRKSLFASGEEVIRSWEILDPIQRDWRTNTVLTIYPTGSDLSALLA